MPASKQPHTAVKSPTANSSGRMEAVNACDVKQAAHLQTSQTPHADTNEPRSMDECMDRPGTTEQDNQADLNGANCQAKEGSFLPREPSPAESDAAPIAEPLSEKVLAPAHAKVPSSPGGESHKNSRQATASGAAEGTNGNSEPSLCRRSKGADTNAESKDHKGPESSPAATEQAFQAPNDSKQLSSWDKGDPESKPGCLPPTDSASGLGAGDHHHSRQDLVSPAEEAWTLEEVQRPAGVGNVEQAVLETEHQGSVIEDSHAADPMQVQASLQHLLPQSGDQQNAYTPESQAAVQPLESMDRDNPMDNTCASAAKVLPKKTAALESKSARPVTDSDEEPRKDLERAAECLNTQQGNSCNNAGLSEEAEQLQPMDIDQPGDIFLPSGNTDMTAPVSGSEANFSPPKPETAGPAPKASFSGPETTSDAMFTAGTTGRKQAVGKNPFQPSKAAAAAMQFTIPEKPVPRSSRSFLPKPCLNFSQPPQAPCQPKQKCAAEGRHGALSQVITRAHS